MLQVPHSVQSGLHVRVIQEIHTDCGKNPECFLLRALMQKTAVDALRIAFGTNACIGVRPEAPVSLGGHPALLQA